MLVERLVSAHLATRPPLAPTCNWEVPTGPFHVTATLSHYHLSQQYGRLSIRNQAQSLVRVSVTSQGSAKPTSSKQNGLNFLTPPTHTHTFYFQAMVPYTVQLGLSLGSAGLRFAEC